MTDLAPETCDTCGAPATMRAVDMLRHEVPGAQWVEFSSIGPEKRGCDAHPVESVEHLTERPKGDR